MSKKKMETPRVAVMTLDPEKQAASAQLATQLGLNFISPDDGAALLKEYDFLLIQTKDYLGLQKPGEKGQPFYIDFLSGKMRFRSQHVSRRSELIIKAMGMKQKQQPYIIDTTAGLGRDSFILASAGFNVTMLERSAIIYSLLQDALGRAAQDLHTAPIIQRLQLVLTEAETWLQQNPHPQPDIIYLDPMFPTRQKSASVKKEMVILQELLGKEDNDQLLEQALACAKHRVVVKRPRLAPSLTNKLPDFTLTGKSSRFDIYLGKHGNI